MQKMMLSMRNDCQGDQGQDSNPGSQAVDAVDHVDGIHDIDDQEHGKRHADQARNLLDPEQSAIVLDPKAGEDDDARGDKLEQQLEAIIHVHKVVGDTHDIHHHSGTQQHGQLNQHIILPFEDGGTAHVIHHTNRDGHRNHHHRKEGDPSQPRNRQLMDFPSVRLIEKTALIGDNEHQFDDHRPQEGRCQINAQKD